MQGKEIIRGIPINQEMLAGNTCFGCSLTNMEGLQIRIYRDGDRLDRLVGEYEPRNTQESLPGIVHGGIQFSALDCMAGWIVFGLRCAERKMPVTLNASIRYRRPAKINQPLSLSAEVVSTAMVGEGPKAKELIRILTEARDNQNELISAAEFEYIAMPELQFCKIVGIEQLNDAYRKHFAGS